MEWNQNCHPWWLVAGSIPVMTSYGHGFNWSFGDQQVCLNIYIEHKIIINNKE